MRISILSFLLIGMSACAIASAESTGGAGTSQPASALFKHYDQIERNQRLERADRIRDSIKNRMDQGGMDLHGNFPYQTHQYVAPEQAVSIQQRSKNTSTYCFSGPDHSSTCGASLTW